jgi:hypothetical protein
MYLNNKVKQHGDLLVLGLDCNILTLNLEILSSMGDNALKFHKLYYKSA